MNSQRWQQVDTLFHSALEYSPVERSRFLDQACAHDQELRRQIQELLDAHEESGNFIENPAFAIEAQALADETDPSPEPAMGQSFGNYQILKSLGAGGMGDVFLAQDLILGRRVALKLLPAHFTKDAERVRRFEQEAQTASALNHPNIVTIYEIRNTESVPCIVTEYIDGATLREHLSSKRMHVLEAIEVAIQISRALVAAHAKGIVHRDIKPENIMLTTDDLGERENFVKVLDFGIAKLTESFVNDMEGFRKPIMHTNEGVMIGTATYMSPEQAQGQKVDERSDIWSLGVVLYEMVTGRAPFVGATKSHLTVAILEKEPASVCAQAEDTPETLEWIVNKTLRKKREERYQSARELLADLRDLKDRLSREAQSATNELVSKEVGWETQNPLSPTSSGLAHLLHKAKQTKLSVVSIGVAFIVVATFVILGFKYLRQNLTANQPGAAFSKFRLIPITTTGKAGPAAISPDGKYIVYASRIGGQESLWMRQVSTSSDVQITQPSKTGYGGLSFSPTGDFLYYLTWDGKNPVSLYQMPVVGGSSRKLVSDVDSAVTFSPDGKQLAFMRGNPLGNEASLVVANSDGTNERKIVTKTLIELFLFGPNTLGPAWSPDGEKIAFAFTDPKLSTFSSGLMTVGVKDNLEKVIVSHAWSNVGMISWLRDGSGLIFAATEQGAETNGQIWYTSYPGGELKRITNDLNDYRSVSLSSDSSSLVTIQNDQISNIWTTSSEDNNNLSQISSNKHDGLGGVCWTPDGRVVYVSRVSGDSEIWIMNADGTNNHQLTFDGRSYTTPSVSNDGRYVFFGSSRPLDSHIWRIDIDGSNKAQLTRQLGNWIPQGTFVNQWLIYTSISFATGKSRLLKAPMNGGEPTELLDYGGPPLALSPKNDQLAFLYRDTNEFGTPQQRLGVMPIEGGHTPTLFDRINTPRTVRWFPDGSALTYIKNLDGVSNIWSQPIEGGPPKQLTNFKSDQIFVHGWSHDGKRLALARGSRTSDVLLIKDLAHMQR